MTQTAPGWRPNPGAQLDFITCLLFECLYHGTRGKGGTDALLMAYAYHVGRGYGVDWRGQIWRRHEKDLIDIIKRSKKYYPRLGGRYVKGEKEWHFPGGEVLKFVYGADEDAYDTWHGQEWPFLGFDELTLWPDLALYDKLKSICRSSNPDVPRMMRSVTNPWGRGHSAVKAYFIDAGPEGVPVIAESGRWRTHIFGSIYENVSFMAADPDYVKGLQDIKSKDLREAWLHGSWDINIGGLFAGVWSTGAHVLDPFKIPASWFVDRSHDWGWSSPHATVWWAESSGEAVEPFPGFSYIFPKGTLFAISEIYGGGKDPARPNVGLKQSDSAIAINIKKRDEALQRQYGVRVNHGPADPSIFGGAGNESIMDRYRAEGVRFYEANNERVTGWKAISDRLEAGHPFAEGEPMEKRGLFFFRDCPHTIRTVRELPRDEGDFDDADTESEDHAPDAVRYKVNTKKRVARQMEIGT